MANPFRAPQEYDRRKHLAMIATFAVLGAAGAAAIGAWLAAVGNILLVGSGGLLGAIVGGALGDATAARVDLGPWEPLSAGRTYVGTHVPDDAGAA